MRECCILRFAVTLSGTKVLQNWVKFRSYITNLRSKRLADGQTDKPQATFQHFKMDILLYFAA